MAQKKTCYSIQLVSKTAINKQEVGGKKRRGEERRGEKRKEGGFLIFSGVVYENN